mmetsp:Transcript_20349/g.34288  ORF Transcript_20349/g.34288 Transcript_20349/m.34288 type:complete len:338 (-) Transcript_20349:326-1339(-)|eukprot:CAMPEP_0114427310 /NCGR_PEP_ID=MMETSP0103-20121206/8276_1 /TAXON_ID=37642 ORGANISM="Paraphysomonas imperforata, Strain PA2" /NCGR_SAMPLE_ID=MMETSP0103 /ASSEMBLY_ACC=CAM_ASM_000201 /LENGTH=337 /DNA_ID=CAMNT_0001596355 /DNA_START=167 /DNA_END=1180 /DNA_ORIENTATION=+
MTTEQGNRWSEQETLLLAQVREALATEIAEAGQFPEVVGDRGIIRFIRGHGELEKIITMYGNFLKWRKDSGADAIRERIREENLNKPALFPNGEGLLAMSPQIIIAADAVDNEGHLITFETFDFSPSAMMKKYSLDDWGEWMIYTMVYKTMVIEQVSELRERALLAQHNGSPPCSPDKGYGVIVQCSSIRCLKGMGMEFLGSDSKAIIRSSIAICQDNFPEMLHKSHMVRTPWVFNTMWYFCKGLMDAKTIAKVTVHGYNFLADLSKEIPISSIPKHFGGEYEGYNDAFEFDWSPGGPMDLSAELRLQAKQHSQEQVDQQQVVMPPAPPTEETNTSS